MKAGTFALMACGLLAVESAWADAFLYSNGVFTTFSVPGAMPGSTVARGINDSGQIVGYFDDSSGNEHGFLDTNGNFTVIDHPGSGGTELSGINNTGQITGTFTTDPTLPGDAFLDSNGTFFTILHFGTANGINNLGEIVGADNNSQQISFVYTIGNIFTAGIGAHSSQGWGINDSGAFVGNYLDSLLGQGPFGYLDQNGVITKITPPGAIRTYPSDINNSGEIVGHYYYDYLANYGFLDEQWRVHDYQRPRRE